MVTRTLWGWAWLLQIGASLAALVGFGLASRSRAGGWVIAATAAAGLALVPALSGHAAAVDRLGPLPIIADALHVVGAAGWLGALLGVLVIGVPLVRSSAEDIRPGVLAAIVNGFSSTALGFAALTVVTGVFAGWLHLGGWAPLWQSAYGRVLLLKLLALAGVFGTGAYNWLRVRPSLGVPTAASRLRRSGGAELAIGALVLLITAVLVAVSPP